MASFISGQKETTPLLWPQQTAFPGSGPFPAVGQVPSGSNSQYLNPYHYFSGYGGFGVNGGPSQDRNKRIIHDGNLGKDPHSQFCALTGAPPTNAPAGFKYRLNEKTLYGRAVYQVQEQNLIYQMTAALTNTLLLLQIVLGAALTGLGGAGVPPYVITIFGATNTIIAGLVAYLKSRGQPMRARMYRDDLERVVDEIENSEVMWLGIAKGAHGYDDIDTDGAVTVRSEVARLTRLLDKAIRTNAANNPDLYTAGSTDSATAPQAPVLALPAVAPPGGMSTAALGAAPAAPSADKPDDESPATAAKGKKEREAEEAKKKEEEEAKKKKEEEASKNKEEEEDKKKPEQEDKSRTSGESTSSSTTKVTRTVSSSDKGKAPDVSTSGSKEVQESKPETTTTTTTQKTGSAEGFGLEDQ